MIKFPKGFQKEVNRLFADYEKKQREKRKNDSKRSEKENKDRT